MISEVTRDAVGVIVARFQVPELHDGHRFLINEVINTHRDVLVILGVSRGKPTDRNPLTFLMREGMVRSAFPGRNLTIVPLLSSPTSFVDRSAGIDALIEKHFPGRHALLYGSRDSFVKSYNGRFNTVEVRTIFSGSASEIREHVDVINSSDFRSGVIYAVRSFGATAFPAVDVAVVCPKTKGFLLVGKKEDGGKLRFPGVFFKPDVDRSFEAAGMRAIAKELPNIVCSIPRVVGSAVVDDWRYHRSSACILTVLLRVPYVSGEARHGTGVDTIQWVDSMRIREALVPEHQPVIDLMGQCGFGPDHV